jgi:hypothetical protein
VAIVIATSLADALLSVMALPFPMGPIHSQTTRRLRLLNENSLVRRPAFAIRRRNRQQERLLDALGCGGERLCW